MLSNLPSGAPEGRLVSRREIGKHGVYLQIFRFGESESLRFSPLLLRKAASFWGIGIAPILSPVTAKGRVRSAD